MPNCAQTHAHSHTHLTRAAFGGEGRVGGLVCDTGPQMSLVSRKLHYLSLAVADKAQRDATRCPDCSCCAVRHPAPPLPLAACSCAAPASQVCQCSAGTLKWRWLSAMRHCAVTHANFKTLSKSQQFFCSISAHRDRAGQGRAGQESRKAGLACCCYGNCSGCCSGSSSGCSCCCWCCILIARLGVPLGPLILHKLCTEIT